ncbi:MAG: thermonuclease family protein [Kiloniellales bacterium]
MTLKVAVLCLLAASALADSVLEGAVTHVRDGDTIEIGETAVRLSGLHAPEMGEDGGPAARAFMVELVAGKFVECRLEGRRSYDREVGDCFLDGRDIAGLLVAAGLGRDCPRFSGGRYRHLEPDAARAIQLPAYCVPR